MAVRQVTVSVGRDNSSFKCDEGLEKLEEEGEEEKVDEGGVV